VEGGIFRQIGHIPPRLGRTGHSARHLQAAGIIGNQAKDDLHHRGFACAIMA
jgi:hypothetical protein